MFVKFINQSSDLEKEIMKNKNINYGLLTDSQVVLTPEIRQNFNENFEVKDASFAR